MKETYRLSFAGFLAVRLMEFDYPGGVKGAKHYSYHGTKLENAVKRLTQPGGPTKASAAELVVWGQAVHDWKEMTRVLPPAAPGEPRGKE